MILGVGIDLMPVSRMAEAIARGGDRFLERLFTVAEQEAARTERRSDDYTEAAGRAPRAPGSEAAAEPVGARRYAEGFAAKEAALKALGTGWTRGIAWTDIEVLRVASGSAALRFSGRAAAEADALGVVRTCLSLSGQGRIAAAIVILEDGA